jgi:hypothetical protein
MNVGDAAAWVAGILGALALVLTAARPAIKAFSETAAEWQQALAGLKNNNADTILIKEMTERIRVNQVDQGELDTLRRWKKAFDSLPECQTKCRERIEQMADDRRIKPLTAKELMESGKQ